MRNRNRVREIGGEQEISATGGAGGQSTEGCEERAPRAAREDRKRRATRETAGDEGAAGYRGEPTAGEGREDRWRDEQAKALKTG
jgi:hypothetical protein